MTAPKRRRSARIRKGVKARVGDRVGLEWAGRVLLAIVVEDRGNLGAHGERVVRIDLPDGATADERWQLEVPADWLVPAPPG